MGIPTNPAPLNTKPAPINRNPNKAPVAPPTTRTRPSTIVAPNGAVAALTRGRAGLDSTLPSAAPPIDVQAMRTMLVKAGYNIPATGNTPGKLFKAALKDYLQPSASHPISQRLMTLLGIGKGGNLTNGKRDPQGFNQRYGLLGGGKTGAPTKTPTTRLNGYGDPTAQDTTATMPGDPSQPLVDLSGLAAIAGRVGGIGSYSPLIPTSYADQLAGLAHDAQIHDLGVQALQHGRDSAQALEDIGHWYDQVAADRAKAATRDTAASTAATNSVKDAVANIVSSLGGSANMGSGLVGAAGADQAGLLSALGANEDQYNADLKPLLSAEAAGAKSRQQALNVQGAQAIQNQIVDQEGQRGQDKANALMQILSENQNRRSANNALDQTRFGDALSIEQAREAAALTGAKILGYGSKTPSAPKGSFGASSTTDRTNYTKDVLSQIMPGGQLAKGMTRSKAIALAQRIAHIYFPHGGIPNGTGLIASIVQQAGL